jgi:methylornithine synthase
MLIEEGIMTGVGNSITDTAVSLAAMSAMDASQVRVMTFIPQDGTPMAASPEGPVSAGFDDELLIIAILRLLFPDRLIPASLDVDGIKGLEARLNAGANVITSIIPPKEGYAGVAHAYDDIDEGFRTVEGVRTILERCGLEKAAAGEYKTWVEQRKKAAAL